ncbi:MAG TPA: DoxX family protein [Gemmatimonadaceae bacterium]|nr:DoxX family protein [Gemmatimonadaceae bacterium]
MPTTSLGASSPAFQTAKNRAAAKRINIAIWTLQVLLACLFLFAGGAKLVLPIAEMTKQFPLPGLFLRFLGVVELAGAAGLILPSLLRIRPYLTPLAAGGLVIVMSGATAISMAGGKVAPAIPPFVVGCLAGLIIYARTRVVPIRERTRGSVGHAVGGATWVRKTA